MYRECVKTAPESKKDSDITTIRDLACGNLLILHGELVLQVDAEFYRELKSVTAVHQPVP
jgi:hypothetical protein